MTGKDVLGEARPTVLHSQTHPLARVAETRSDDHLSRAPVAPGGLRRVLGILQQVVNNLPNLLRVAADWPAALIQLRP